MACDVHKATPMARPRKDKDGVRRGATGAMQVEAVAQGRDLRALRGTLLAWYRQSHRDLPWRRTRDPYAIWVSEIMLQQTQVDTVAPRYAAFLQRFPTVADLAAATEHDVCEAWAGLGYYRRARHLHAAAVQVVARHGGALPVTLEALLALPGVGRYTAGAIASIAHGQPAPLVDGNVARILSRIFLLGTPPQTPAGQATLWALAEALVQGEAPGDLNQALMELGATVCTPAAPRCDGCPVRADCAAHAAGTPTLYPAPAVKAPVKPLAVAFAYVADPGGLWLARRPLDGLWAGLWELPSSSGPGAKKALAAAWELSVGRKLAQVSHTLTHRQVTASIYAARPRAPWQPGPGLKAVAAPLSAPLSALARKAIQAAQGA
jgi:A/G-specific adenine glycosylase